MAEKRSGIYCIENTRNGKVYVGSSVDLQKRSRDHFWGLSNDRHPNVHLQRAWKIDGENAFRFKVLEFCEPDVLLDREAWWMELLRAREMAHGYNFEGALGRLGRPCSEETRAKMSATKKGKPSPRKGIPFTAEHRANMSAARKGKPVHPGLAAAQLKSVKGVPKSAEWKQALSERNKGNKHSLGRKLTPEHKAAITAANNARWAKVRAERAAREAEP